MTEKNRQDKNDAKKPVKWLDNNNITAAWAASAAWADLIDESLEKLTGKVEAGVLTLPVPEAAI